MTTTFQNLFTSAIHTIGIQGDKVVELAKAQGDTDVATRLEAMQAERLRLIRLYGRENKTHKNRGYVLGTALPDDVLREAMDTIVRESNFMIEYLMASHKARHEREREKANEK